ETPVNPYRVIWELLELLDPGETVLTADAGWARDTVCALYSAAAPHGYLGWGKSMQLGSSLGLIMGAKLASRDRLCVAVMGDAAVGTVGMELETAVRCKIPILAIVLNNGTMALYGRSVPFAARKFQAATVTGDYRRVAEGLGTHAARVTRAEQVRPA